MHKDLKDNKKILLKIFILIFTIVISLQICNLISESYFFDKIFLQKSCIHGYQNKSSILCKGIFKNSIIKEFMM